MIVAELHLSTAAINEPVPNETADDEFTTALAFTLLLNASSRLLNALWSIQPVTTNGRQTRTFVF